MGTIWLICDGADDPQAPENSLDGYHAAMIAHALGDRPLTAVYATSQHAAIPLAQHCNLTPLVWALSAPYDAQQLEMSFRDVAAQHQHEEIAILLPAAAIRALLCRLLDLPQERGRSIHQQPGAINRVIVEPHRTVVAGINDCCHMQA